MMINLFDKLNKQLKKEIIQIINVNMFYLPLEIPILIFWVPNVFIYFGTSYINIADAKSILNLLVQSEAAVIAIVITLSLVAVQLAASSYSARVTDIFKRSISFWIIVILYIFSIVYGLILLAIISVKEIYGIKNFIFIDYLLGIIAFISLIYFILVTFDLLKPEKIIGELSRRINNNFIDKLEKNDETDYSQFFISSNKISSDQDQLLPLIDIIIGSIEKGHTETAEKALKVIEGRFLYLINNNNINTNNGKHILEYFLERIERAEKIAISNKDDKMAGLIIKTVANVGNPISRQIKDFRALITFFKKIYISVIQIELEFTAYTLIDTSTNFISYLTECASLEYDNNDFQIQIILIMRYLHNIWVYSSKKDVWNIENHLYPQLYLITMTIADTGLNSVIKEEIRFLLGFGIRSLEKDPSLIKLITTNFATIFDYLLEKGFENNLKFYKTLEEAFYLSHIENSNKIRESIVKYGNENEIRMDIRIIDMIEALKFIGFESIEKNTHEFNLNSYDTFEEIVVIENTVISRIINVLENICLGYLNERNYIRTHFNTVKTADKVINRIIDYLGRIGLKLARKKSNSVSEIIRSLYSISETLINQYIKLNNLNDILKILDLLNDIELELISSEYIDKISECSKYIKNIGEFATKSEVNEEFSGIRSWSLKHLWDICLKLTENKLLLSDFKNSKEYPFELMAKLIDKKHKDNIKHSIPYMEKIAKEMEENNFKNVDIESFLNSLKSTSNLLRKNSINDLAEEIEGIIDKYDPKNSAS